jgi:hypothetical protein
MDYRKASKARANEAFVRAGRLSRGRSYQEDQLEQRKTFLIICEGKNTEPYYFKGFPVPSKTVLIEGGCHSKNALVDYALVVRGNKEYIGREVWCVFDFDIKPDEKTTQPEDFNTAIEKAERNGLKVAWSNDAFELWFVLHYDKLDSALTRQELSDILKKKWNLNNFHKVAKTKEFCKKHYTRHGGENGSSQQLAIKRARGLHASYNSDRNFASQCPCTTVYLLVEELNKNCK